MLLQVDQLSFQYDSKPIFQDVSFALKAGELCAILGINGSGKSTLFKCIMGFIHAKRGSISFDGINVKRHKIIEIAKKVAYVPQVHPITFPYLVREMVLMGRTSHIANFLKISDEQYFKVEEALQALSLGDLADKPFNQLSGGQRQMVLIARALAQETKLMLLDEPTSSLDFKNQLLIWRTLLQLKKEGKSVLVCTHDPNHVLWFCDRVLILDNKKLIADGPPKEVMTEQLLQQVYGTMCTLEAVANKKMVLPRMS
ncbi:MAG: ABC transporter ATP-binding protein [Cecembia sp.]